MKILVTFAVDAELAAWRRRRAFRCVRSGLYPAYEAEVGGITVRVLLTGVGGQNARRAMQLESGTEFAVAISSGLAGGLKPRYRSGDVLAAHQVEKAEGGDVILCDPALLSAAAGSGAIAVDAFRTSRKLVVSAQEKARLGQAADAVEMESFDVLEVACERGIRSLAVRVVMDPVEENLPMDFTRFLDQYGRVRFPSLLAHVALRPWRTPGVVRLAKQSRRAASAVAEFLDEYVQQIAELPADEAELEPVEMTAT